MAKTPTTTEDVAPTPVTITEVNRPSLSAEDFMREQEKGASDPVDAPKEPGAKAEPVGVGKSEPYPTGNPPPDPFYRKPEE